MAIEIFSKVNGSITTLIEDIKDIWNWSKIVTDDDGAVTELWVSDKVYLAVNGDVNFATKTTSGLAITPSTNGTSYTAYASSYLVVKTENTLAIFGGYASSSNAKQMIIISKTADVFDTDYSGYGVVATGAGNGATIHAQFAPIADKSTAVNSLSTNEGGFLGKTSDSQTLICPIVDRSSSMYFTNLNYKICSPSASSYYKSEMNGKKYYITPYVAIEYED